MYALDMQQKILEPLSPMTQSSLLSFAELFSFMMSDGGYYTLCSPFNNEKVIVWIERGKQYDIIAFFVKFS